MVTTRQLVRFLSAHSLGVQLGNVHYGGEFDRVILCNDSTIVSFDRLIYALVTKYCREDGGTKSVYPRCRV